MPDIPKTSFDETTNIITYPEELIQFPADLRRNNQITVPKDCTKRLGIINKDKPVIVLRIAGFFINGRWTKIQATTGENE
tara:strand:- start:357 stop:596 length:240 start_codon:yes stop_codon:yes gene_type:complete